MQLEHACENQRMASTSHVNKLYDNQAMEVQEPLVKWNNTLASGRSVLSLPIHSTVWVISATSVCSHETTIFQPVGGKVLLKVCMETSFIEVQR